jgi:hypothetical protein
MWQTSYESSPVLDGPKNHVTNSIVPALAQSAKTGHHSIEAARKKSRKSGPPVPIPKENDIPFALYTKAFYATNAATNL